MKVKLKQVKKTKTREQIDLDLLKQQGYKDRYKNEVRNKYEFLNTEETPQQLEPDFIENKMEKYQNLFNRSSKNKSAKEN